MNSYEREEQLIRAAVAGSRTEFAELLRSLEPEMRSRVRIAPLWRRSLSVDDVLQVSWLEAFLRIGSLRDATPPGLRAWLIRIIDNNLRDAVRSLERDKRPDSRRRQTQGVAGESIRGLLQRQASEQSGVSQPLQREEEFEHLRSAIQRLPKSYRLVIERMDIEERDVDEVAEELGRSRGAVHLLRSRARERLRELLAKDESGA